MELRAIGDARFGEGCVRGRLCFWKVEHRTAQLRIAGEHVREERSAPATDVENRPHALEVQCMLQHHRLQTRPGGLRVVERVRGVTMGREIVEEPSAVRGSNRIGASARRPRRGSREGSHCPRSAEEPHPTGPAAVAGEEPCDPVGTVTAAAIALHTSTGRKVCKKTFEHLGVGSDNSGQLRRRAGDHDRAHPTRRTCTAGASSTPRSRSRRS